MVSVESTEMSFCHHLQAKENEKKKWKKFENFFWKMENKKWKKNWTKIEIEKKWKNKKNWYWKSKIKMYTVSLWIFYLKLTKIIHMWSTRVTLKLLILPLTFWTLDEIENSAHSKVKTEDWTGRKREKVGQLCPSTETGAVQGWAMVDSGCQLHSFNQSINQWLRHDVKQ